MSKRLAVQNQSEINASATQSVVNDRPKANLGVGQPCDALLRIHVNLTAPRWPRSDQAIWSGDSRSVFLERADQFAPLEIDESSGIIRAYRRLASTSFSSVHADNIGSSAAW